MAALIVKVKGTVITGETINGFKQAASVAADNLTVWANACAIQSYNGNSNWSNDLFASKGMQLANGELSAMGKKVLGFIKSQAPRFNFTADKKAHLIGKDKTHGKQFVVMGTKTVVDSTDFVDFDTYLNFIKPKAPKATGLNAQTVINQVAKALAANVAGELEGNPALLGELASGLAALLAAVSAANAATDEKALADAKRIADGEARELAEIEAEKAAVVDAAKVAETLEVAAAAKPAKRAKRGNNVAQVAA